jgi:hypothetical protein
VCSCEVLALISDVRMQYARNDAEGIWTFEGPASEFLRSATKFLRSAMASSRNSIDASIDISGHPQRLQHGFGLNGATLTYKAECGERMSLAVKQG